MCVMALVNSSFLNNSYFSLSPLLYSLSLLLFYPSYSSHPHTHTYTPTHTHARTRTHTHTHTHTRGDCGPSGGDAPCQVSKAVSDMAATLSITEDICLLYDPREHPEQGGGSP